MNERPPPKPDVEPGAFRFGTKAGTLAGLAPLVTLANFCDQIVVPVARWQSRRDEVIGEIIGFFAGKPLAVRSSALSEDGWDNSNAGSFVTVTGVQPTVSAVGEAFDRVVASYAEHGEKIDDQEVLIQPMLGNVALSGVVLTRDLDTGGPYYVINYDDYSGRTDTVTGGAISKAVMVHRNNPEALRSPRMRKLVAAIQEIEAVTGGDELDIEFCVTEDVSVYVLQVRPLAARRVWQAVPDAAIDHAIAVIRTDLAERMRPQEGLAGSTTILGEMPDWNPAEMIGNAPRPLALSLYKRLIGDRVWADARADMGYRRVSAPLIIDLHGRPYVDVRLSLNSFVPADLDDSVAGRLVERQLAALAERPDLHDKIEFELAVTCRDFAFETARGRLKRDGLSEDDLAALEIGLTELTGGALSAHGAELNNLLETTDRLLEPGEPAAETRPLERVASLLADCEMYGTRPFAQLARHGFIGVLFLKSLVTRGVFTPDDEERFLRATPTVASRLVRDMQTLGEGRLDGDEFLKRYGHLRPGAYDITSWRYDERPELYLGQAGRAPIPEPEPFAPSARQLEGIASLLAESGYGMTPEALLEYIGAAIQAREQAKFAFTRSLSEALRTLDRWGEDHGLSRDEVSFLPIEDILGDLEDGRLRDRIAARREDYLLTRALRLPHLLTAPADIDVIRLPLGQPNFITGRSVTASVALLTTELPPDIDGRIVLIESADPGFDWIFSHGIAGLITKYGGVNSHMAIRSAEFGLPAAIGCGERLFETLSGAGVIELNCAAHYVRGH